MRFCTTKEKILCIRKSVKLRKDIQRNDFKEKSEYNAENKRKKPLITIFYDLEY